MQTKSIWDGVEVISSYTRAQALEDGVLVDITDLAREAGFKFPVAVTRGVWGVLKPTEKLEAQGQSWKGRGWDMLAILRHSVRRTSRPDAVYFAALFVQEPGRQPVPIELWAKCGPGDNSEPVMTVMLRGED